MAENSTAAQSRPELLAALLGLLAAHRSAFKQERPYRRALALVFGELFAFARHTVTQSLLALGLTDADWTAWYRLFSRRRFEEEALSGVLLRETLAEISDQQLYVIGIDATQMPRSSQKMPGTGWLRAPGTAPWRRGIHRAQRFEHGAWLPPIEQGYSRAISLRMLPAFPEKAVPSEAGACKEWAAGLCIVRWVRQVLDDAGRAAQSVMVLADGAYDTIEFWRGLPERTVAVVRSARNRRLRKLPEPQTGRGRRRKYGEQAPAPADWLKEQTGWLKQRVEVRGRVIEMRYRIEGPYLRERVAERPLWLLVVGGASWQAGKKEPRRAKREPCFYLLSALNEDGQWQLPLPDAELLAWLWQRWELEVAHREMKSGFGVGEKQCWNQRSAVVSVQWSAWVYGVLLLAGYRAWGWFGGPARPERWWGGAARWSLNTLWRGYRAALWGKTEFRALWTTTANNWPDKDAWLSGLTNAAASAART